MKRINRYGKGVMLTLLVSVGTMFVGCSDELFDESEAEFHSFQCFNNPNGGKPWLFEEYSFGDEG